MVKWLQVNADRLTMAVGAWLVVYGVALLAGREWAFVLAGVLLMAGSWRR